MGCIYVVYVSCGTDINPLDHGSSQQRREHCSHSRGTRSPRPSTNPHYIHINIYVAIMSKNFSIPPEMHEMSAKILAMAFSIGRVVAFQLSKGKTSTHDISGFRPLHNGSGQQTTLYKQAPARPARSRQAENESVVCQFHWTLLFCVVYSDVICPAKGKKYHVLTPSVYGKSWPNRESLFIPAFHFVGACVCVCESMVVTNICVNMRYGKLLKRQTRDSFFLLLLLLFGEMGGGSQTIMLCLAETHSSANARAAGARRTENARKNYYYIN